MIVIAAAVFRVVSDADIGIALAFSLKKNSLLWRGIAIHSKIHIHFHVSFFFSNSLHSIRRPFSPLHRN